MSDPRRQLRWTRAWPSFALSRSQHVLEQAEKAVCLWLNTSLGLIGRWYVSNRQQPGRGGLSILTLASIPVLDINQLSKPQLQQLANLFDKYSQQPLQSAYLAELDATRQTLDREVLIDVLGLPDKILQPLSICRQQWCSEFSVRGSKK